MYHTPQDVTEISWGVIPWWGVQGCTRCVLFKNSHIVSHVIFFALAQFVNFSQILKPCLSESVNFLYFAGCLFVMLVRWPSLDHESFFVSAVGSHRFLGHLKIAWRTWGMSFWNATYCTVSSLRRYAVACFGGGLQCTASCEILVAVQTRKHPWNYKSLWKRQEHFTCFVTQQVAIILAQKNIS